MQEIWKDVEGYEGLYKINNYGEIKSLKRNTKNQYKNNIKIKKKLKKHLFQIQVI